MLFPDYNQESSSSTKPKTVAWFSAGVSSAVTVKLLIGEIDEIRYSHIEDQHPDTMRFLKECEAWFGKEIIIMQSDYKNVENVIRAVRYVNGPAGAPCTRLLKKRVRKDWEATQTVPLRYAWGLDCNEKNRADRIVESMPEQTHVFPLIDQMITKEKAHEILKASGIKRPAMYDMGYRNNNCIGCVKGGMGYWNHIRRDYPEVFASRAKLEREIGASCIRDIFLDELDPERGRDEAPIVGECGILCEIMALK